MPSESVTSSVSKGCLLHEFWKGIPPFRLTDDTTRLDKEAAGSDA